MIVVIGIPIARPARSLRRVTGVAPAAALAAARSGARVELVGKVGDDEAGDAAALALAQAGVGHAALLRDPAHATPVAIETESSGAAVDHPVDDVGDAPRALEPADRRRWPALEAEDVELALRYLPDIRTIVVAEPVSDAVLKIVRQAARYLAARLVVVTAFADAAPDADLVLAPPDDDRDSAFAGLLGEVAAALERGEGVENALESAKAALGVSAAR